MPSPADCFGRTYVINLPERKDRLNGITRELNAAGLGFTHPKVRLFCATRSRETHGFPSAGARGCFLSHLGILTQAREEGLQSILVLEDDLALSPLFAANVERLLQEVMHRPWGFVYFGHREETPPVDVCELVPFSGPVITAHFYAVNGSILDRLISYLEAVQLRAPGDPEGGPMHYDGALTMFRAANPDILTLISQPNLGWQRSSRSDIHGHWYDKVAGLRKAAAMARSVRQDFSTREDAGTGRKG
jgi:glycosyl transferase family 25